MAGHSKWANIRFRKAAQDARRGKLFTKLIREITVAARSGGGDPASNSRLRSAVDKAIVRRNAALVSSKGSNIKRSAMKGMRRAALLFWWNVRLIIGTVLSARYATFLPSMVATSVLTDR